MKFLRFALLGFCLLGCSSATAGLFSDRNFDQDHMTTTNYGILILSPFEEQDHITSYSNSGSLLWDVTVNSKVISWKLKDGLLVYQLIVYL